MEKTAMQEHIEDIFARKAKCGDNDTSLADVLERDISTSFAGGNKFIYELLQNADDAGKEGGLDVSFRLFQFSGEKYLLFSHNGGHFEVRDVDKITSYANQRVDEKTIDPNKIGYKGIGFKAIFTIAKSVVIFSKGYQFRFDSEYKMWKQCEKGQAYPWQIIPIWTEISELPEPVRASMADTTRVNFLLRISPKNDVKSALEFIKNNTRILLFLRCVQKLTISLSSADISTIEARRSPNGQCDIYVDGKAYRSWLIKSFSIPIPEKIRQTLVDMSSHACPDRLKNADNVTISFAAFVRNGRLIRDNNLYVYCYLPTQVNCGLPFVINGDFLLDPARAYLADNQWNQFILGVFAQKQFEWLAELACTETYRKQVLNILSQDHLNAVPIGMSANFKAEFTSASRRIAFIPGRSPKELLLLSQAIIDDTNFYRVFPDLMPSPPSKKTLVDPNIENLTLLRKLNVEVLSFLGLLRQMELHVQENKTIEFQVRLIRFMKENDKKFINSPFKKSKLLLSQDGIVLEPSRLYFPANDGVSEFPGYKELKFLHIGIYEEFSKEKEMLLWLKELGVNQSDPLQFVRGYVFELINKKGVTVNDVVALTRFTMRVARDHKLTSGDWDTISKLPVLAESGALLKSYEAYLPDILRPVLPLQALLQSKAIFVSQQYFFGIDPANRDYEMQSWQQFFIKIGVHADITFVSEEVTIERGRERLAFFSEYLTFLKQNGMTAKTIQKYHRILHLISGPLMNQVVLPDYARIFINRFLEQWRAINSGYQSCYRDGNSQGQNLDVTYLQFIFQNKVCFPGNDNKLYKTTQLYDTSFMPLIEYDPSIIVVDSNFNLTHEQLIYFKIKGQLSFDQCCILLQKFHDRTELICFSIVWRQLLQLEHTMRVPQKTRLLKLNVLFPNQNDELCQRQEIACFAVPGEDPPLHSSKFLKCFSGFTQAEMVQIAKLLGISVVGEQVRILDFDGKLPALDQRTRAFLCGAVHDSSPWSYIGIAVWLEHRRLSVNVQTLWDKIAAKFIQLQFYRVERLSYHFGDKSAMAVSVPICLDGSNFYYVRDWKKSPPRLSQFLKTLGSYLELSEDTVFKLERLILACNRKEDFNEYLQDWHLPEQPNVKQIFPKLIKQTDVVNEDNFDTEQEKRFSADEDMFGEASSGETSDEEFQQGDDSPEDPYELNTPPSDAPKGRRTPTATPIKKSANKSDMSMKQFSSGQQSLPLVDVNKFDYGQLFRIQEAKLSVKNSSATKVKVSVQLYDSTETRQPMHAGGDPHGAFEPPENSDFKKTENAKNSSKTLDVESKHGLTKADKDKIGRCGEELIYLRQRYRYEKKYPNCKITDMANGFEVIGQDQQGKPVDIKVIWHNKDIARDEDRDITIVKPKPKGNRYLEVKATTTNKPEFNWTAREIALAQRKGNRYRLFHIASIGSDPKVAKIKNPATKLGTELQITGYKVKF